MSEINKAWSLERRNNEYSGRYKIDKVWFKHTLFNGDWTEQISAEMFVRGNVTAVLPYDPKTDQVVLVEQFRIGAMHQKPDPWLTEVIAGMIEPGEASPEAAVREAREEAGLELNEVQLIAHYLASPGASTEEVSVYFALTDLSDVGGLHGLAEEDEDIRVLSMSADEAIAKLERGDIKNGISIIAMQWFRHYRLSHKPA